MKLEEPNRQITVPAQLLADSISLIRDYIRELAEISDSVYLDDERESAEKRIAECKSVWDKLSEAIESPFGPEQAALTDAEIQARKQDIADNQGQVSYKGNVFTPGCGEGR
jgi:hypothetical protein